MKLATSLNGHAIGVYDPVIQNKERVHELIRDHRIKYFAKADYSEGSELETLLFKIINYTQSSFELKSEFHKNLAESLL